MYPSSEIHALQARPKKQPAYPTIQENLYLTVMSRGGLPPKCQSFSELITTTSPRHHTHSIVTLVFAAFWAADSLDTRLVYFFYFFEKKRLDFIKTEVLHPAP